MSDLWKLSATQAQAKILSGNLSLETYVRSLLHRINERDHAVLAWAYLNRDHALAEARRLDAVPGEQRGPLHGFVIGIKDNILTKDMPTCYNSPMFASQLPITMDANVTMTLRACGALILGKTETCEWAASPDGPRTRNPHDTSRTPGGTSSGSAAAVGDFQVPLSLGTQTLGSLIRPGSYNGIYAYKPTWGSISRDGFALTSAICDTLGFYSRSVEDLEKIADVFKIADSSVMRTSFKIAGARIGFAKTPVWPDKVTPALEAVWSKAKAILSHHGANVEEFELPGEFSKVPSWHAAVLAVDKRTSFLGQYSMDKSKLHPLLVAPVENSTPESRQAQLAALDGCARLRPIFDELASKYDALLTPTAADEAPQGMKTGDAAFCMTWSIMHGPVVNIPGFIGSNGLPIGLSLIAGRYQDRKALHAAAEIGRVFEEEGGWKHSLFSS